MLLQPLTSKTDTAQAFKALNERLRRDAKAYSRIVGYPGGHERLRVLWHPSLGMWCNLGASRLPNRYWCVFGTTNPTATDNLPIVCEINPPFAGLNLRCAGLFVRDQAGNTYLAHTGKIGGGRRGIGKSGFLEAYGADSLALVALPGGDEAEVIVIGRVDAPRFPSQLTRFVREVEVFKESAVSPRSTTREGPSRHTFKPEFSGQRRSYQIVGEIESQCDHGAVVDALKAALEREGLAVGKDQQRDIYVHRRCVITVLFEVKTAANTSSLYEGVGQLMLHGAAQGKPPKRILVLPNRPNTQTAETLARLGIKVLVYRWVGDRPVFSRHEVRGFDLNGGPHTTV